MGARHKARPAEHAQRTVAVIGSEGFLGRRLTAALASDLRIDRVVAIDVRPPATTRDRVHFVRVDLTRPGADRELADVLGDEHASVLVHLAFLGAPAGNPTYAHELEAIGTMHVTTAAAAARVPRLVLQSTTALYGASPKNPAQLSEAQPLPAVPARFLADKADAEGRALRWAGEPGRSATLVRLAPIIGPSVDNLFTRYLLAPLAPTIAGFDPLVQAVHEDDAVAALHAAIHAPARTGPVNVVGAGVVPLSTAIRVVGTTRLPLPISFAAGALTTLAALGATPAPGELVEFLRWTWVADGRAAARHLGFTPRHTTRDALVALASRRHGR